jgi:hypothetical protein
MVGMTQLYRPESHRIERQHHSRVTTVGDKQVGAPTHRQEGQT